MSSIHEIRLGGFAVVDVVGTILGAWGASYILGESFTKTLLVLFIIGECLHFMFNVKTRFLSLILGKYAPQ